VKGHCEIAAQLIAHGADVNSRDNNGSTALDEALRYRHGPVVSLLLEKSNTAAGRNQVLRQLWDAVMRGQTDMVTLLLEKGADANAVTPNGSTLLHDAALKGNRDIVAALLASGAKVNCKNAAGGTALHDAALAGSRPVALLLLERGADMNAIDTETGATPLHYAASWGRSEVLTVLIEHGAELNIKNRAGQTPLRAAVVNEQKETAQLLRRRGAKE
jgi:ankyrin repeat protein